MMKFNLIIASILVFCLAAVVPQSVGFSLLGPLQDQANGAADPWQGKPYGGRPGGLGYSLPGDIGGPMLIEEGYRWNVPVITYGFDPEFVEYFGQAGVEEVEKAVAIFNALPPASNLGAMLDEYSLDTKGQNTEAEVLGLLDVKSITMALLLEQLGLGMPERFVWSLRARDASAATTNYTVLNLNYDPVTWQPSHSINNLIYNHLVFDDLGPRGGEWASAVEWYQFDPDILAYSSVASGLGSPDFQLGGEPSASLSLSGLPTGHYFSGLTRDDVGGLRFLLNRENKSWESLLPGVSGTGSNALNYVNVALRAGVEKLTFQRQEFDSAIQRFRPVTNIFSDVYFPNETVVTQILQRVVTTPDILFRVRDIGGTVYHGDQSVFVPRLYDRSSAAGWENHVHLNSRTGGAGPGIIQPPVHITFNKLGRYAAAGASQFTPLWAAFDGSDVPPLWLVGNETNINNGLVVESRLVMTNDVLQFEWTTLRLQHHGYTVEVSTNLVDWTLFTRIEPFSSGWANAFTLRYPVGESPRFFRTIREPRKP